MNPAPTIEAMRRAARALDVGDVRSQILAVQAAQDALDAAKAELLAELEVSKGFEADGASTMNTWVRNELRMNAADAANLVRASATFAALPLVAQAAAEGSIRADHVKAFTYGLKHLGPEIMGQVEEAFVVVAQHKDPAELFQKMRELRDAMFPDDLDEAYVKGMDKEDIQVSRLSDGWHVTGFLNAVTGAKFKKVLDSVSAPRSEEDDRTGAERRVQGFDDLLSGYLNNGMPSDKGINPQLAVMVDADTLEAAAARAQETTEHPLRKPTPMAPTKPAKLIGYGPIGPNLLMYFMCVADFTAFLMKEGDGERQAEVLNVGRNHRLATLKQRRAIAVRQDGVCATPGCKHTHLEIHHVIFWRHGGNTDLNTMIGLCSACHHLLHADKLHITGNATDGFEFTNRHGTPLGRRRRINVPTAA